MLDAAGITHDLRVTDEGEPRATFDVVADGRAVTFTAGVRGDSLCVTAHRFTGRTLSHGNAGLFNAVNREWAGCAAYAEAFGGWSAGMAFPLLRQEPDPEPLLAHVRHLHAATDRLGRFANPMRWRVVPEPPPSIHQVQSLLSEVGVGTQLVPDEEMLVADCSVDGIGCRLQAFVPDGSMLVVRARRPERRIRDEYLAPRDPRPEHPRPLDVLGDIARLNAGLAGGKVLFWPGAGQLYVDVPVLLSATGLDADVVGWCLRRIGETFRAMEPVEERDAVPESTFAGAVQNWSYPWATVRTYDDDDDGDYYE